MKVVDDHTHNFGDTRPGFIGVTFILALMCLAGAAAYSQGRINALTERVRALESRPAEQPGALDIPETPKTGVVR